MTQTLSFVSSPHMYQGHRLHASSIHVGVRDGKEGHSLRDSPKEKMDRKMNENWLLWKLRWSSACVPRSRKQAERRQKKLGAGGAGSEIDKDAGGGCTRGKQGSGVRRFTDWRGGWCGDVHACCPVASQNLLSSLSYLSCNPLKSPSLPKRHAQLLQSGLTLCYPLNCGSHQAPLCPWVCANTEVATFQMLLPKALPVPGYSSCDLESHQSDTAMGDLLALSRMPWWAGLADSILLIVMRHSAHIISTASCLFRSSGTGSSTGVEPLLACRASSSLRGFSWSLAFPGSFLCPIFGLNLPVLLLITKHSDGCNSVPFHWVWQRGWKSSQNLG